MCKRKKRNKIKWREKIMQKKKKKEMLGKNMREKNETEDINKWATKKNLLFLFMYKWIRGKINVMQNIIFVHVFVLSISFGA